MVSDRTRWGSLRELTRIILKLLPVITERSWSLGKVPDAWRKANVTIVINKGKSGYLRVHQPHGSLQESDAAVFHGRFFKGLRT